MTESVSSGQLSDHRSFLEIWSAAVPMITITVVTLSANGAILIMFLSRQALRRCKHLYFVSLSLADFLLGLTMVYKMTNDLHHSWDTGWKCRLYQSCQSSLAYVSFLSIFLIIMDKWRAVHYPVSYRNRSTKFQTVAAVLSIWLVSFVIFTVPQLWWRNYLLARSTDMVQAVSSDNGDDILTSAQDVPGRSLPNNSSWHPVHRRNPEVLSKMSFCPEVYHLSFSLSLLSLTFFYVVPLIAMLIFDVTLHLRLKLRKSVEVQRSTSVTDTYFMTLKKPALELTDSCRGGGSDDDTSKELLLKNPDAKPINKHLAIGSRGERRHSSLPAISPIIKGRTSSGRRVSMPESNSGGGCRYVGRKWSGCASAMSHQQNQLPNPVANLAPRLHPEDMVHDLLVKQDRKTITCLCLLLVVLVVSWLPHALVGLVHSHCWCLFGRALTASSWFRQLDHALNPFLYGLMYVQFQNVVKQWLLMERVHAFKMRDTLILKHLQKKLDSEESGPDRSPQPPSKFSQFDVSQITSQTDLTLEDADSTPL